MEFDKSKVYTALNADELKVGSEVYLADSPAGLENAFREGDVDILRKIEGTSWSARFYANNAHWHLAYLISEPEEKKLKWTDLKVGDIIRNNKEHRTAMVVQIDEDDCPHIFAGNWLGTLELKDWEKVEVSK